MKIIKLLMSECPNTGLLGWANRHIVGLVIACFILILAIALIVKVWL